MGRKFATFYRIILMATSISAVVVSIISATSCAFVTFDHQYKTSSSSSSGSSTATGGGNGGRRMLMITNELRERVIGGLRRRRVQAGNWDNGDGDGTTTEEEFDPTPWDGTTTQEEFDKFDPIPEDGPSDVEDVMGINMDGFPNTDEETAAINAAALSNAGQQEPEFDALGNELGPGPVVNDPMAETYEAGSEGTTYTPNNGPNSIGGDTMAVTVSEEPSEGSTYNPSNGPNGVGDAMAGTVTSETSGIDAPSNGPNGVGGDAMAGTVTEPSGTTESAPSNGPNGIGGDPMAGQYSGGSSTPQSGSAYGSSSTSSAAPAIVKGDAGLFCQPNYKDLWNNGNVNAFEAEVASESDYNKSEEIARNAVLAAVIVGAFMATILTIECLLGWQMCLEKWFIGFLALVAVVSQGTTFAFFNSQRYCDGDILHEILNQEPCVLAKGGVMSIVALFLYFLTLLLVCKVPQDDPYGLCCKGKNKNGAEQVFQGEDGNSGLLMGSNPNNPKPERPNWISEDSRKEAEEEENEII